MGESWAPRRDRELEPVQQDVKIAPVDDPGPPPPAPELPARIKDMRFVQHSPRTTQQKVDFAYYAAYGLEQGPWRALNIMFVYVVAIPGHLLADAVKWAFFDRLSRFLIAVPVAVFLAFCLNHIPLVQWAVPDQADVSTWWSDPPDTVVVDVPTDPSVPPVGGE